MNFEGDHRTGPETERLRLRAVQSTDAEAMFRLNGDPEVIRSTGAPPWESLEETQNAIASYPDWERHGIGRWAAIDKATGVLIGFAGLKFLPELDAVDLGYRFLPEQ
jgi:ribosomal-protein-alanine N-acetyltransferase